MRDGPAGPHDDEPDPPLATERGAQGRPERTNLRSHMAGHFAARRKTATPPRTGQDRGQARGVSALIHDSSIDGACQNRRVMAAYVWLPAKAPKAAHATSREKSGGACRNSTRPATTAASVAAPPIQIAGRSWRSSGSCNH